MRSASKSLSTAAIFLYIAGLALVSYVLYSLPGDLTERSDAIDLVELNKISPLLNALYLQVGGVLVVGLLAIILTLTAKDSKREVVYLERQGKENTQAAEGEDEETAGHVNDERGIANKVKEALQQEHDTKKRFDQALTVLCNEFNAVQATVFRAVTEGDQRFIELYASYAYAAPDSAKLRFEFGEGLAGQAIKARKTVVIDSVPEDYIKVISGLGQASPQHLLLVPLVAQEHAHGIAEFAFFGSLTENDRQVLESCAGIFANELAQNQPTTTTGNEPATEL